MVLAIACYAGLMDQHHPGRHWQRLEDARPRCDICPRQCNREGAWVVFRASKGQRDRTHHLRTPSGFCIDPVEKKLLNHFLPELRSFPSAPQLHLSCRFCQNWDISKPGIRSAHRFRLSRSHCRSAKSHGCRSVAFTHNDPVIFLEERGHRQECRERGVRSVQSRGLRHAGSTAESSTGWMPPTSTSRATESFYRETCGVPGPGARYPEIPKTRNRSLVRGHDLLILDTMIRQ